MSVDNPHVLGPVVINPDTAPVIIGDITSSQIRAGVETVRDVVAGTIYPQLSYISQVRPMGTFTTKNPSVFLAAVGVTARCPTGDDEVAMYIAKRDCNGVLSGSAHARYMMTNFIIVPRSLSITHPGDAELSFEIYGVSESSGVVPMVKEPNVALPATYGTNNRYEFGKLTIAGTVLQGKRSLNMDFGTQLLQESSDSENFDSFVGVQQVLQQISIGGVDNTWVQDSASSGAISMVGTAGAHANTDLYLAHRDQGTAIPVHIKFTTASRWYADDLFSGSSTELGTTSIIGEPYDDGSNVPIIVTTGVAIT